MTREPAFSLTEGMKRTERLLHQLYNSDLDTHSLSGATPINSILPAIRHTLNDGGKRIRPHLAYSSALAVEADLETTDLPALTIELVHTYSLIHDDLPAMDDDDFRRGKPSLHKAFDEATAILVGDGLQAKAFELIADAPDF